MVFMLSRFLIFEAFSAFWASVGRQTEELILKLSIGYSYLITAFRTGTHTRDPLLEFE